MLIAPFLRNRERANMSSQLRVFGLVPDSIVDGPGLRYGVFVQGCSHGCPGCHNPESHDPCAGEETTVDAIMEEVAANKLISGVTLSGGEPFEQAAVCAEIGERAHELGLNVWTYTGYRYEDLLALASGERDLTEQEALLLYREGVARLLATTDVLVDGPFVESMKSLGLQWRGSSNQRVIDMVTTRKQGSVVLWSQELNLPEGRPDNW